jgi:hypothetical protein
VYEPPENAARESGDGMLTTRYRRPKLSGMNSDEIPPSPRRRGRPAAGTPLLDEQERAKARSETLKRTREKRKQSGIVRSAHDLPVELFKRVEAYSIHSKITRMAIIATATDLFLKEKGF